MKTPDFEPLVFRIPLPNFEIGKNKSCSPNIYLKLSFQAPPQIQPLSCSKLELNILGSGCFQSNFIKPANLNIFFSYFCSQNAKFAQQQSCISDIWLYFYFQAQIQIQSPYRQNLLFDRLNLSMTDPICQ